MTALTLDATAAQKFLDCLCQFDLSTTPNEHFVFQTIHPKNVALSTKLPAANKPPITFAQALPTLNSKQAQGAGIFVQVNAGKQRGAAHITAVRAVWLDMDGADVAPVMQSMPKPHMVVATSAGRYHLYWLLQQSGPGSLPPAQFNAYALQLADAFGGDTECTDLSRVMRLPGSWHTKGQPSFVTASVQPVHSLAAYDIRDLQQRWAAVLKQKASTSIMPSALSTAPATSQPSAHTLQRGSDAAVQLSASSQFVGDLAGAADFIVSVANPDAYNAQQTIASGSRVSTLVSLVGQLAARGKTPEQIEAAVRAANDAQCQPPLTSKELYAMVLPATQRFVDQHTVHPAVAQPAAPVATYMEQLQSTPAPALPADANDLTRAVYAAVQRYVLVANGSLVIDLETMHELSLAHWKAAQKSVQQSGRLTLTDKW